MNQISSASLRTALNPNAREFVPTTLRSSSSSTIISVGDEAEPLTASDNGKGVSGSSGICVSDEESRRYQDLHLPDDLLSSDTDFFIPAADHKVEPSLMATEPSTSADELKGPKEIVSWERLSFHDEQQGALHIAANDFSHADYNMHIPSRHSWEDERALPSFQASSMSLKESSFLDALSLLANEFPSLPVQCLADVYQANGGDLALTVLLLKLQNNPNSCHNLASPSQLSTQSLEMLPPSRTEFMGAVPHNLAEILIQQHAEFQRSAGNGNGHRLLHEWNGPVDFCLRPSGFPSTSHFSSFSDSENPYISDERFEPVRLQQKHPLSPRSWMEHDDALVNAMLELQEEALNHGRIRDFYVDRAQQAAYAGDGVHVKEATARGQFYNRLMKAAQSKAADIERQRVPLCT